MDQQTINTYNQDAKNIADLHASLVPTKIYNLINQYFTKALPSIDIGCGIGRDTHWLNQQGYPCVGIDASIEMLNEAQKLYPNEKFTLDKLPNLENLGTATYDNILCSAVLMHLQIADLPIACSRLVSSLKKEGCLILSFRKALIEGQRENGKLYETISQNNLINLFEKFGCTIMYSGSEIESKRNLTWHNLVVKK